MESTKLTLRPPADVGQAAHLLAKEENTSITQLFTSFIMSRRMENKNKTPSSPPALCWQNSWNSSRLFSCLMAVRNCFRPWGKKRKMRFFLNTSILLDVLERRHPFFHSASHLCGP